ncbi:MAG: SurA N-terminal domain-containing protein [bacterium]|nr:SurA N-terminal domain-containing protein [bacterium]
MKKTLLALILVALLATLGWFAFSMGSGDAVALVNGEKISRADFETFQTEVAQQQGVDLVTLDDQMKEQLQTLAIDELVARTLLRQAVEDSNIAISDEDIDVQLATIKGQFGDEATFYEALTAQGLTEKEFRAQIKTELATQAYFDQNVDLSGILATDEEIATKYDELATEGSDAPPLEEVREQVRSIVVQEKERAIITTHVQELAEGATIEVLI